MRRFGFMGGEKLQSFAFVASGSGTTPTITVPGTPTAGDLCVIWNCSRTSFSAPATVLPSGFTQLLNHAGNALRAMTSAKKLVGSETTVTGMDGDTFDRWIAATFRPNIAFVSFAGNSVNGQVTSGNPTLQTIASGSAASLPAMLLGQMGVTEEGAVAPRSTSPAMTELAGAATNHYAHYFLYGLGGTPVNHTYDMDDEGVENAIQSCYLTFT